MIGPGGVRGRGAPPPDFAGAPDAALLHAPRSAASDLARRNSAASAAVAPGPVPRRLIALAGPPGAGKSTLAPALAALLGAVVVPMDGFHLDNRLLDAAGMRQRKGAPETFDIDGLAHTLRRLKSGEAEVILPSFDRDRDAAIAGAIRITSSDRLLLVEGNYLLSRLPGWADLAGLWDASILLEVPHQTLAARLAARWHGYGLAADAVAAHLANDMANVDLVMSSAATPTLTARETDAPADLAARLSPQLDR